MADNVAEWVQNDFRYYDWNHQIGNDRVLRGGATCIPPEYMRVSARSGRDPRAAHNKRGGRLARSIQ